MSEQKDYKYHCTPETCQYHYLTESVISDLKESVIKLLEGQEKMSNTIIQMTEAFKAVDKLDGRLEKLEDNQKLKDEQQDSRIDELRMFMYKAIGGGSVIVAIVTMLGNYFM